MTRWKGEEEERRCPKSEVGCVKKRSAGFSGGQVIHCAEVSSSMVDCSSTSTPTTGLIPKRSSGTEFNGKENEYDFVAENSSSEADSSTVQPLRNVRTHQATLLGQRKKNGVSTSSPVHEKPSSSGLPSGASRTHKASDFLKDSPKKHRGQNHTQTAAGSGCVIGGDSSYMNCNRGNMGSGQWPISNRANGYTATGPERPAGDVGLVNHGNTCYMNSGLQCLLHTPNLVEYFLKLKMGKWSPSLSFVAGFQELMEHVWFGLTKSISLHEFRDTLYKVNRTFEGNRQHDCQEFLVVMLDNLHEQLKKNISRHSYSNSNCGEPVHINGTVSPRPKNNTVTSSGGESVSKTTQNKRNGIDSEKNSSKRSKLDYGDAVDKSVVVHSGSGDNLQKVLNQSEVAMTSQRRKGYSEARKVAADYWEKHIQENNTVIASTFHGLFKSTVVCEECEFVSVTHEPFMYLAVPIPRVSSRNICVTFLSMKDRRPMKVSISLQTDETVSRLKELVSLEVPGLFLMDCVVAEVVNNNIARRVDDEVQISYLSDSNRNIYMYELNDNFCDKYGSLTNLSTLHGMYTYNITQSPILVNKEPEFVTPDLEENWDEPAPLVLAGADLPIASLVSSSASLAHFGFNGPEPITPLNGVSADTTSEEVTELMDCDDGHVDRVTLDMEPSDSTVPSAPCIICLEDQPLDSLRRHKCGGILCIECLPRAASFFEENSENKVGAKNGSHLKCPTCGTVVGKEEYMSFSNEGTTTTLNLVGVLLRLPLDSNNNTAKNSGRLFGAPFVLRLPSTVSVEDLYSFINDINPFPDLPYTVVSVLWDGVRCVRCFPADNCDGCEIPKEGEFSVPPGTALAISYLEMSEEQMASVEPGDMASVSSSAASFLTQPHEPVHDIHDCLRAFSQVERLEEPIDCENCKRKTVATRTMNISRLPDCLIIYLNRFVVNNQMALKLTNKLRFPLTNLDMNSYIAPEEVGKTNLYDLYSCVCHYGTTAAGHYTAYSKNPMSNSWSEFNDSAINHKQPSENDFESAYVLFYQRKGMSFDIPKRTEDRIRRFPPSVTPIMSNRPTATALVVSTSSGSKESSALNEAWNNMPVSTSVYPEASNFDVEADPLEENDMICSPLPQILQNSPHLSSAGRIIELPATSTSETSEAGGFLLDEEFEADSSASTERGTPEHILPDDLNLNEPVLVESTDESGMSDNGQVTTNGIVENEDLNYCVVGEVMEDINGELPNSEFSKID